MKITRILTPLGTATIKGDHNGIAEISILDSSDVEPSESVAPELALCAQELQRYFQGTLENFSFKMNPAGSGFQKEVWKQLSAIPYGKTISYLELAQRMGDSKKTRAVAAANAANPLWIVVPCHRVIGSDGSLTGYAGGLWRKKWLLAHEQGSIQTVLFE
ncbi:methylated-DNA--[protein]-cysteine S-methyltransferase [Robertkochia aurantiaca]|uniref:methylated-DNA--[protein]-cysteine S-methyltransferase n=1 Tax=Robertkochia aurantiaca TaxID=2873700 RepID=UPI001CCBA36E|nr:methylated-DNA--[protein]-cysteine S-methyltransferase [Robertkochia sp. 3YJGBD-33]